MKVKILQVAILSILPAHPLLAQEMNAKAAGDAAPMMNMDRATFVKIVSSSNAFEINSSELANQKAQDPALKKIAQMIVIDHQKAGEKLNVILESEGADMPSANLEPKHRKMLDQLSGAAGKDFDILYLDMQTQAHMEAIAIFRTYAGSGEDQTLVGFAKETLPRLETHLGHVKMIISAQ